MFDFVYEVYAQLDFIYLIFDLRPVNIPVLELIVKNLIRLTVEIKNGILKPFAYMKIEKQ